MKLLPTLLFSLLTTLNLSAAEFYIFGDSLSDAGNSKNMEPYNFEHRYTNGKVWNEYLADMFGHPIPIHSDLYQKGDSPTTHATNFARGGAMTHHGTTELAIPSIFQQVQGRLSNSAVGFPRYGVDFAPDDVVSIWGGANNLFFSGQTQIREKFEEAGIRAAKEQAQSIRLLLFRKAKRLIVFNLPDIGKTPSYSKDPDGAAKATRFCKAYNDTLAAYLKVIEEENPSVTFTLIDVEAIFTLLADASAAHGFTNSTTPLIEALAKDSSINPDTYVFYDDVHPTTAAHKFIAAWVFSMLVDEY